MATPIKVGLTESIPAGSNVVAVWVPLTLLPEQSVLEAVATSYGEPFTLTYYEGHHQGVTLAATVPSLELYSAFAKAAGGNSPVIMALSPDAEGVIDIEKTADEFKEGISDTFENIAKGASVAANLPKYLLIGGLVIGGVLLVGGVAYLVITHRKGGKR